MTKRLQNPRLAKIHRCYTVNEIAYLYQATKNTVRNWIKKGLVTCDVKRPTLIRGADLNAFHANRRIQNKHICKPDEIYCLPCRKPKKPIAGMVEYRPVNEKTGNLVAICPSCERLIYRRISNAKIELFISEMGFTLP